MLDFRARFKQKTGADVQLYAPYVYDSVMVMAAAMQAAKSAEPAKYLPELKKMFSNSSLTDPTLDGFAKRFKTVTAALLASDGSLTTRTDGLGQQLTRNQKDQDTLTIRLAATEKRIRAQYTALDKQMASLNSLSNYVTQQLSALNNSSDN